MIFAFASLPRNAHSRFSQFMEIPNFLLLQRSGVSQFWRAHNLREKKKKKKKKKKKNRGSGSS